MPFTALLLIRVDPTLKGKIVAELEEEDGQTSILMSQSPKGLLRSSWS
jgi:hypothetical protein